MPGIPAKHILLARQRTMSKPHPKEETLILEEDNLEEQVAELLGPYFERIFKSTVWVMPVLPDDEKQNAPTTETWQ